MIWAVAKWTVTVVGASSERTALRPSHAAQADQRDGRRDGGQHPGPIAGAPPRNRRR